jgi:hypothetical protein
VTARSILGGYFYPEDGGDKFLGNVGSHLQDNTASQSTRVERRTPRKDKYFPNVFCPVEHMFDLTGIDVTLLLIQICCYKANISSPARTI